MQHSYDFRFKCIRCGNCCSDAHTIVNVTYFDIIRIKEGLNLSFDELLYILGFYIFEKALTGREREKMVIPPIKTEKGLAFIGLNKKKNGECYFFDAQNKKCKIYDIRPMFCRTFPFSFKKKNKIENNIEEKINIFYSNKGLEYCPGIEIGAPLINTKEWLKLGIKTLKEIERNEEVTFKYNKLTSNGKINPTVRNFLNYLLSLNISDLKV